MAIDKLNANQIRNARCGKHFDGAGLFLQVLASGNRYWRMKYYYGGREKLIAFGVYPEVSLAEARQRRDEARTLLRQGRDPVMARRAERREAVARASNNFETVCLEWVRVKGYRWSEGHRLGVISQMENDVFPRLGCTSVAELTPADILFTVRQVERRGAFDSAGRLLQRIRSVLNYAVATGRLVSNPARDLRNVLIPPERGQHAAMAFGEVGGFLATLDRYPGNPETRIALEMLVHTFVRSQEVRLARWSEFDPGAWDPKADGRKYWRIPAERMKKRREHVVPLSPQVRELLAQLRRFTGNGELLFPHRSGGGQAMTKSGLRKAMAYAGFQGEATIHGFRAQASTELNERGFHADAIERQLAHEEANKSRRAYNRASYLEERCKMMDAWSGLLACEKRTAAMLLRLKEGAMSSGAGDELPGN